MRIAITEESHNQVIWDVRTPLLWIELGLLVGWLIFSLIIVGVYGTTRWWLIATAGCVLLSVALYLALTTPLSEHGELERLPDGGETFRQRRWLLRGQCVAWTLPMESVGGFGLEMRIFEALNGKTYPMARLWLTMPEGDAVRVTEWGEPAMVQGLGESLAKAARRPFEGG